MGVWLEAEEAGRSSASTSSVMEDSWTSGPIRIIETAIPYTRNQQESKKHFACTKEPIVVLETFLPGAA